MRNGPNKRMRGRNNNHRKSHNPMTRVYESNGPDVKIRGTPPHIAEKYVQLARDAHTSGDPVSAENYYQHAEHYFRLIAAAQEQFRQNNPHLPRLETEPRDDAFDGDDDDDDMEQQPTASGGESTYGTREPQPYLPPDAQPFPTPPLQQSMPRPHQPVAQEGGGNVDRLPSFITGGGPQQPAQAQQGQQPHQGHNQNGHDNQADRFPLHRRRRRHRGPRHDSPGGMHQGPGDGGEFSPRGD
jgi:Domain of unknown function (DUF4167)